MNKCIYFNSHMDTILQYCKCLYKLKGCAAGGPLHILLDDYNIDRDDIMFCIDNCLMHPDNEGSKLGLLICNELLPMTYVEREVFIEYWSGWNLECKHGKCEECDRLCMYHERLEDDPNFAS